MKSVVDQPAFPAEQMMVEIAGVKVLHTRLSVKNVVLKFANTLARLGGMHFQEAKSISATWRQRTLTSLS